MGVSVIHPKQGSPTNTLGAVLNSPKSRRASVATHQQRQQSPNSNSPNSNSSDSDQASLSPKIRSLSLIEPVKEEDENALMEEIDQLARQRNSSLAPSQFKQTLRAIKQVSIRQRLLDWYNNLYWPYDYEETILGLRYVATGFLPLAAAVSLLLTFVGSKTVKTEL